MEDKYEGMQELAKEDETFAYDSMLLYDALIRSTDDFIYLCNMKTGMFRYSPLLVKTLGFPAEVMTNPLPYWRMVVHPEDWERFYRSNAEVGDEKTDYHSVEFRALQVNGEYQWLRCRGYLMRDEDGEPTLFAGIMYKLEKENKIDGTTSLYSIHEFSRRFDTFIRNNYNEDIGMMVIGLDDFTNLNSMYDRLFGDLVLRKCGHAIMEVLPKGAGVYRLDGDEFGILMEHPSEGDMESLFEAVKAKLEKLSVVDGSTMRITCSAGCACYPQDANSYLDMVKYCDYAMQYSKEQGKNRLTAFHEGIRSSKSRSLEILHGLQESIFHDCEGFYLKFQPQTNAQTGKIKGVEALLRWRWDSLGPVSPEEFVPVLEENRLIDEVGKWVFQAAVRAIKEFACYQDDFTVSINVSYLQLMNNFYMNDLIEIIKEAGVNPRHIVIELTESYRIRSMQFLREILGELRSLGISIAMDDFGSGYSSLELLKNAPFDMVKVDKGFINGILQNTFDASFIQCIVKLCHDVGIAVCLEGVETEAEYRLVKEMGPDMIQGFYFGKPQVAEGIIKNYLKAAK